MGLLCLSLFCYALLCVHSSFAIILKRKRKLVALLLLSYRSIVAVDVLWLFLTVPLVGLQCVIVVFPDHTQILFATKRNIIYLIIRFRHQSCLYCPYEAITTATVPHLILC